MKLATIKSKKVDGTLVVVSKDLKRARTVPSIAPTLQAALDDWNAVEAELLREYNNLNSGGTDNTIPFNATIAEAPLPRAYHWCDGGTYTAHMELMTKWMGHQRPEWFEKEPLVYQGGSDHFLGAQDDIVFASDEWGIDYEAEVAVITDRVPMGTPTDKIGPHIKLIMLCNDISLRNLIPFELNKGFGFYQSKPASTFSPVAVTPDELGDKWDGDRLHLPIHSSLNGKKFGQPDAGSGVAHGFRALVGHATKTRVVGAGSIFAAGAASNAGYKVGHSCIIERRVLDMLDGKQPSVDFMKFGDRIRIEMFDSRGESIFGAIDQKVSKLNDSPQDN